MADLQGLTHHPLAPAAGMAHVLIFITTDCPIANGYAPEIQALVGDFAGQRLQFFLVHTDPDVTPELALRHAAAYGHSVPILLDHQHQLVRQTGVTVTPEAVVVTPGREIVYRGRIDNWYGDLGRKRPRPTRRELRSAITAVLAGQPVPTPRTQAIGCFVSDLR